MSATLWDNLHDGFLVAGAGQVPGDLIFTVEIPYVMEVYRPGWETITVTLHGCELCRYETYAGDEISAPAEIAALEPTILSARGESELMIVCVEGFWYLRYAAFSLILPNGSPTNLAELQLRQTRYWSALRSAVQSSDPGRRP